MISKPLAAAAIALGLAAPAYGQVVISNGNISLGVNPEGHLNVNAPRPGTGFGVGVYDNRTDFEATWDHCKCEGWGVASADDFASGFASVDNGGIANVSVESFIATATTATSIVAVNDGTLSLQVIHAYAPSLSPDLFQAQVTITNRGTGAITDLRYRRAMDWDIEPTPFDEYVTIGGVGAPGLIYSSDNGFAYVDPLYGAGSILAGTVDTDFIDSGPVDHGAVFDLGLGGLAIGDNTSFTIFYGAALSEAAAYLALNTVGAEVYSLGQSSDNRDGGTPDRSTFIFGISGIGGSVVSATPPTPPSVPEAPEPAAWAMMLLGAGVTGGALRGRRRVSIAYA